MARRRKDDQPLSMLRRIDVEIIRHALHSSPRKVVQQFQILNANEKEPGKY